MYGEYTAESAVGPLDRVTKYLKNKCPSRARELRRGKPARAAQEIALKAAQKPRGLQPFKKLLRLLLPIKGDHG